MKLHSAEFEKRLRREVRLAVRASPRLKKESRKGQSHDANWAVRLATRAAVLFAIAGTAASAAERTNSLTTTLAVVTAWGAVFVVFRAQALLQNLYASPDLAYLAMLPVSDRTVFQWQFQKFIRGSLPLGVYLGMGFLAAASFGFHVPLLTVAWAAPAAATLACAVVIASAALCISVRPQFPYVIVSALIWAIIIVLFVGRGAVLNAFLEALSLVAPGLNVCLPTGWPTLVFGALIEQEKWSRLVALVPIGGLLATFPSSIHRIQKNYRFMEQHAPEAGDVLPEQWAAEAEPTQVEEPEAARRLGPTAIEEVIESRRFLMVADWGGSGMVERWLWKWLTPREKVLADFAFPNGLRMTAAWRGLARSFAITVAAWMAARLVFPEIRNAILGVGLFITSCQLLARIFENGRSFSQAAMGGLIVPTYAFYGIGFRELAHLLFKGTLVQAPFIVAFTTGASVLVALHMQAPIGDGLRMGLHTGGLAIAARLIILAFSFSGGTNDGRMRFWSLILALATGFGCMIFLILGLGTVVGAGAGEWLGPACLAGAYVDAYAVLRVYGWFYNRNRFDLMRPVSTR